MDIQQTKVIGLRVLQTLVRGKIKTLRGGPCKVDMNGIYYIMMEI